MPIKQPDGNKVEENCCVLPNVVDGVCRNCGYKWKKVKNWVEA